MMSMPKLVKAWTRIHPRFLPFADVATPDLPLGRLLRLSLFQVSVGMATSLLVGTLNRVMIVEMYVDAWVVALMVALPLVFAPFRALIGHKSDTHRSILGWRRVPYIWIGTWLQFGGLAIMPFALILRVLWHFY
jgi:BCD family chlorophyll transporter-like MFS transporter